jgi:hypothetical protein
VAVDEMESFESWKPLHGSKSKIKPGIVINSL